MISAWTFTSRPIRLALCLGTMAICAVAASSIATVTSAVPFTLDGHSVSTPGVTSFPLVVGDTVATSGGVAVLLFQDGSKIKLGPNSSVRLSGLGAKPKVILLSGTLDFKLIPGSNIAVVNLDAERKQAPALASASPSHTERPAVSSSDSTSMVAKDAAAQAADASSAANAAAAEPTAQPVAIATSSTDSVTVSSTPEHTGSKLASAAFLVPAGAGAAGLATALFRAQSSSAATTSTTTAPTTSSLPSAH